MTGLMLIDEELAQQNKAGLRSPENSGEKLGVKFLEIPPENKKRTALSRWQQYALVLSSSNEFMQVR